MELRQAGILIPILVLGYTSPEGIPVAWKNHVTVTLFTPEVLEAVRQLPADPEHRLKVHIR
ncbi:hypothetical protein D3C86_1976650 [compost metagenome]